MERINYYDSHLHLLGLGYIQTQIDLSKFKSISEIRKITSQSDIILGRGWNQEDFLEKRFLNKTDLNCISVDKPVIFTRVCGHILVCNDKAMEIAGINMSTNQICGGSFDVETGIFTEDALKLIYNIIPEPTDEELKKYFIFGDEVLRSYNITKCASDDFSTFNISYERVINCLKELYESNEIQVEIYEQVNLPTKSLLLDFISKGYHKMVFKGLKMGPLKLLADGSLGGRTAYLKEEYSDEPGNRGIRVFSDEELEELIYIADSNGMDVAIHAIGDACIEQVINSIYKSMCRTNRTHHRHSIIHAQLATKDQIKRMADLRINAIVQPIFLNSDIAIVKERLGEERAKESYLFKTMYNEGVRVGFSTDAPVESVDPEENLYCAMSRKSIKNSELGQFLPEESFTYEEAMECYTTNNLWLSYDEGEEF